MKRTLWAYGVVVVASMAAMGMMSCSKKSVQSGGDSTIASVPDTGAKVAGQGLQGLAKNPPEERVGSNIMVALSGVGRPVDQVRIEAGLHDVLFGYDSWTVSEEGRQVLTRDAEWMKSNPGAQVNVEGHCDVRGTSAYNLVLGEKRAKVVRNHLVELGVVATRLSVVSFGKEQPSCTEHVEACYQKNRRAHLTVKVGK